MQRSGRTGVLDFSWLPRWVRVLAGPVLAVTAGFLVTRLIAPDLTSAVRRQPLAADGAFWLACAAFVLAVIVLSDAGSLAVLVRALRPGTSLWAGGGVAVESRLVEGATSFGGLEIPFQVVRLRRLGLSTTQASSVVVVKGLVHASVLLVVASAALVPGLGSPLTGLQRSIVLGCLATAAVLWSGAWLCLDGHRDKLIPRRFRRWAEEAAQNWRVMRRTGWGPLAWSTALQCVNWAATLSLVPVILLAFGWHGPWLPIVLAQAVLPFVISLSPLPGGAGMAELGYLQLVAVSMPAGIGVASLALWRLMTWVIPMMLGAAVMVVTMSRRSGIPLTCTRLFRVAATARMAVSSLSLPAQRLDPPGRASQ